MVRGMLVSLPGRKGVGSLESAADGQCNVSIFLSLGRVETIEVDAATLEHAYLSRQTRAYVMDEDRIRVGRVTDYLLQDNGLVTYEVRFPNGKRKDFSLNYFLRAVRKVNFSTIAAKPR
jgi:ATP-dependent helicase HepA